MIVKETFINPRNQVVLRELPASDSKALEQVKQDQYLHLLKRDANWLFVRTTNNLEGWIPQWYLDNPELLPDSSLKAQNTTKINFYQSPDKTSKLISVIPKDTYFDVTQESLGWARIQYDNSYGFVESKDLNIIAPHQVIQEEQTEENTSDNTTIKVRVADQGGFDQPSIYGQVIYNPVINEEFTFIESMIDEFDNEWYLVKNASGIQMYIEARISAFLSDSKDHNIETNAQSLDQATVILDPGHGGEDVGALPSDVILEKEYNLETANVIKKKLEEAGATVFLTRQEDIWLELEDRVAFSNSLDADIFISIHHDASSDPTWHGTTTYYFHEDDYDLAVALNQEISQLPLQNTGATFGNYQVIRENHHPAVLLELGFLSNPSDLAIVQEESYKDKVAQALVIGLDNYFKKIPQ